ncbi:hypothetical protein NI447_06295 [Enterococcus lactis]|nr:hypothetical protein [Enterococcus lactis]
MAKTTNPYWREESRIYHLELEIARTSNPQKKRELGYLLEKEKQLCSNENGEIEKREITK